MYVADSRASTPGAPGAPDAPVSAEGAARPRSGRRRAAVAPTVLALGTVSLITDVSSEMVTAVLPLYLVAGLGLSPLGFGLLDGVYNGFSALVRLAGGHLADRGGGRHKWVAGLGYGISALCKPLLLLAHSLTPIGLILAADRTGKGLRTAPRDALISLSSTPQSRGRAFGVHRAMDTTGALLGPLVAFWILRATVDGYDAVFTVSFCVAAVAVLVLALFVPGGAPEASVPEGPVPEASVQETSVAEASVPEAGPTEDAPRALPAPHPAPRPTPRPTLRAALALLRHRDLRRITVCAVLLGLATVSDSFVYLLL
ncbi:MFS transporter, partial [Streptomyces carpinensis]|uniref:MFS transporter n=1 Tax=Streptomyces carpinensis TaxID=66369 RepID=UPI00117C1439